MINKALVLKQRPDETFPNNMDFFEVRTVPIPVLNDGEILIQVWGKNSFKRFCTLASIQSWECGCQVPKLTLMLYR